MKTPRIDGLLQDLGNPPREYGPVPFYWWSGEPLNRERLAWQLERLDGCGVAGVNVNYTHAIDSSAVPGDPPYFSPEWWDLWKWFVGECGKRGMAVGFDDYVVTFIPKGRIGSKLFADPSLRASNLHCAVTDAEGGVPLCLEAGEGGEFVRCVAYRLSDGAVSPGSAVDLSSRWDGGLSWTPPAGAWRVAAVTRHAVYAIDPLNSATSEGTIRHYFAEFEKATPGEVGRGLNYFFQDELNLRIPRPVWHARIPAEFLKRKGYDILPLLPALWTDIGPETPRIRMDYNDVFTALFEESYWKPLYEWTSKRGILYGCDQSARGYPGRGYELYGDYFRAIRWFSAPGAHDPLYRKKRDIFEGKVSSSIAHLYERPRAWVEGYHSSGWGITPAEIVESANQNFMFGYTLLNLHGLYYTTYGGWFEWAPPDFHFRQPYWRHMGAFNRCYTRLAWLLSRGKHACDAAILYPTAPFAAGTDGPAAEKACKALGETLFRQGLDFDYIDDDSVERAEIRGKIFHVAGEAYRALVVPSMRAIRHSSLRKLRDFRAAGGLVIAYGCLPEVTERIGRGDPEAAALAAEAFDGTLVPEEYEEVVKLVGERIERDFLPDREGICVLHRSIDGLHAYAVCSFLEEAVTARLSFRARGRPVVLDVFDNLLHEAFEYGEEGGRAALSLDLHPYEMRIVLIGKGAPKAMPPKEASVKPAFTVRLDGDWESRIEPLLDNTWGDFRLPVDGQWIGAEARRFRFSMEAGEGWQRSGFDDSGWKESTYTFGPRFLKLGPIPAGTDPSAVDGLAQRLADVPQIAAGDSAEVDGKRFAWSTYEFSERWGIEKDVLLGTWSTGPHGLKKEVPDEFLDVTAPDPGDTVFLWTRLRSPGPGRTELAAASRSPYEVFLNGRSVLSQEAEVPAGVTQPYRLPDYHVEEKRVSVDLAGGEERLLVRCVQTKGQRLRLYAVVKAPEGKAAPTGEGAGGPTLRWFSREGCLRCDAVPAWAGRSGFYRFMAPPGLESMTAALRGEPEEAWVDGRRASVGRIGDGPSGSMTYRIRPAAGCGRGAVTVALRVRQASCVYGGAVFAEPVQFGCGTGLIRLGDWGASGLAAYSGGLRYGKRFTLEPEAAGRRVFVNLGGVRATAEVFVNGESAGIRIAPPWRLEITRHLAPGENELHILVTNTLANHYSVEIPTGFVFPGQTASGLMGPVDLEVV